MPPNLGESRLTQGIALLPCVRLLQKPFMTRDEMDAAAQQLRRMFTDNIMGAHTRITTLEGEMDLLRVQLEAAVASPAVKLQLEKCTNELNETKIRLEKSAASLISQNKMNVSLQTSLTLHAQLAHVAQEQNGTLLCELSQVRSDLKASDEANKQLSTQIEVLTNELSGVHTSLEEEQALKKQALSTYKKDMQELVEVVQSFSSFSSVMLSSCHQNAFPKYVASITGLSSGYAPDGLKSALRHFVATGEEKKLRDAHTVIIRDTTRTYPSITNEPLPQVSTCVASHVLERVGKHKWSPERNDNQKAGPIDRVTIDLLKN